MRQVLHQKESNLKPVIDSEYNRITPDAERKHMDFARFYMHFRGSVICVRDGAVIHKGIIHSVQIDGNAITVWIMDNNPHRRCVGYRTLEDFTGGASAWLEFPVQCWQTADAIIERAESQLGRLYDVFTFNCEHFVALSLGLEPESKQLQSFGWLAFGLLVFGAIASHQPQTRRPQRSRRRRMA